MELRKKAQDILQQSMPLIVTLAILVGIVLIVLALPARTAAVLLGIVLGILVRFTVLDEAPRTQNALFWVGIGVIADAAYARLNDLGPVTITNALMKVVDAFVKLLDPVLRSFVLLPPDFRARLGSVTAEFVWSFVLALVILLAYALWPRRP